MKGTDVFISYSHPDQKWADKLSRDLAERGVTAWIDRERLGTGSAWNSSVKEAIKDARTILVLVGRGKEPDGPQSREAQGVLDAVWSDPDKRVIPVLMGNAAPPGFVRSAVGGEIQAIRIGDPRRDWTKAIDGLVRVLKDKAALEDVGETIDTRTEDRVRQKKRLSYIHDVAERFGKGMTGE